MSSGSISLFEASTSIAVISALCKQPLALFHVCDDLIQLCNGGGGDLYYQTVMVTHHSNGGHFSFFVYKLF